MKKSKKIILTISAVTLTAGVLLTGIGYMKGGRFGFVFSDGKFISADSIEEEKQPFILEKVQGSGKKRQSGGHYYCGALRRSERMAERGSVGYGHEL